MSEGVGRRGDGRASSSPALAGSAPASSEEQSPGSDGFVNLARTLNEQRLLETLLAQGPQSQTSLARLTGLSQSTVSSLIEDLRAAGLVRPRGVSPESQAHSSADYETVSTMGFVCGADVGGTKIRAGIADVFGEIVVEQVEPTKTGSAAELIDQLGQLFEELRRRARLEPGHAWAAGVGMPGIFDRASDRISAAPNLPDLSRLAVSSALVLALGVPVVVDNDVNLAAVGECWRGLAANRRDFVAISIGTGVGMGLVVNGELVRGSSGAAGEIDSLSLGTNTSSAQPANERFEASVSASAILERLRRRLDAKRDTSLSHEDDVATVFEAASHGDEVAKELLDEEARYIAFAIAAVAAVLDPGLVVLGGGIGSNPLLLNPVRRYVALIHPRPLKVEISALGGAAAFHGAIAVALQTARQKLAAKKAV